MDRRDLYSTISFPDRLGNTTGPTLQDEEMLIRRLPKPTSSVACSLPTHLKLRSRKMAALLRRLDVSGAVLYCEAAPPNEGEAWVPLLLPKGTVDVRGRVTSVFQRHRGACWVAELKFELTDNAVRSGIVGLVKALKLMNKRRALGV